jgi:hypothetical protein
MKENDRGLNFLEYFYDGSYERGPIRSTESCSIIGL